MNHRRDWFSIVVLMGLIVTVDCRPAAAAGRSWNRSRSPFVWASGRSHHPQIATQGAERPVGGFVTVPVTAGSDFYCNGYPTRAYKGLITKLP